MFIDFEITAAMIERLCMIAGGLIVLLALSMLVPTRKKITTIVKSEPDESEKLRWVQLAFSSTIAGLVELNEVRRSFDHNVETTGLIRQSYSSLLAALPEAWIDVKSKQLKREQLERVCSEHNQAQWQLLTIGFDLQTDAPKSVAFELACRDLAAKYSDIASAYAIVGAASNNRLIVAVPYAKLLTSVSVEYATSLLCQLYAALAPIELTVDDAKLPIVVALKATVTTSNDEIGKTIDVLLERHTSPTALEYTHDNQWHALDAHALSSPGASNSTTTGATSASDVSQILAGSKKKAAAMCIKDDDASMLPDQATDINTTGSIPSIESSNVQTVQTPTTAAMVSGDTPTGSDDESFAVARQPKATSTAEAEPSAAQNVATASKGQATKDEPLANSAAVANADIDELFAMARKSKSKPNAEDAVSLGEAIPETKPQIEEEIVADIQAIQATVGKATPQVPEEEPHEPEATQSISADDIAKLFAAAKANR
jgi:hypothetical protein